MRDDDDLHQQRHGARPDDLASLRRLDAAMVRAGFRVAGKTVREWVADFARVRARWFDNGEAVSHVIAAGLGAVPVLVDTLRAKRLDVPPKADSSVRAQCIEALGSIEPLPTCAIPALLETLRTPSARVRWMVLAVLERMRPRPTAAVIRALLPCLQDKHDAQSRSRAARVLAQVDGALPAEVRRAAMARLMDSDRSVRRQALQVLGRFPGDAEVLTALEEQALLDDVNRLEALRILADLEPSRAFPLLLDVARRAAEDRPGDQRLGQMDAFVTVLARREEGMRALLLIARLGERAVSTLPELVGLRSLTPMATYANAAIDDLARDVLRRRAPPLAPERFHGAHVTALLRDVPPPREPDETPGKALARWAEDLREQGPDLIVRVALAAARRVLGLWEYQQPNTEGVRRAVMAMDRWVCQPAEALVQDARLAGYTVPSQFSSPDAFSAAWSVTYATRCLPSDAPGDAQREENEGDALGACVNAACRALSRQSVITWALGSSEESPTPLQPRQAAQEVRRAILDEVLPWALGTWDPVKDVVRLADTLRAGGAP
ncbi:HEAT repeat domain-containing protein [Pyxidicoccus sp. MSG2]|uniref:HEAT repeat domain-containing protein n=1 Tax=Pyxidicoccus sp. MSG2 TaxID=2996790 RepID=UPI00226F435B|nr:HEAT repeat domain-containing protein [Pyxidicoccus sp. MSG2]MCY1023336.1 HEAT repeat domain-containing protein [Pyxidicoccus sp. MSG2]